MVQDAGFRIHDAEFGMARGNERKWDVE